MSEWKCALCGWALKLRLQGHWWLAICPNPHCPRPDAGETMVYPSGAVER